MPQPQTFNGTLQRDSDSASILITSPDGTTFCPFLVYAKDQSAPCDLNVPYTPDDLSSVCQTTINSGAAIVVSGCLISLSDESNFPGKQAIAYTSLSPADADEFVTAAPARHPGRKQAR